MERKTKFEGIYLYLDTQHVDYAAAVVFLRAHNDKQPGNTLLGMRFSKTNDRVIIKVSNLSTVAANTKAWSGAIIRLYTHGSASTLRRIVEGQAWVRDSKVPVSLMFDS